MKDKSEISYSVSNSVGSFFWNRIQKKMGKSKGK